MRESLDLFKSLQNAGIFSHVKVNILLNKVDIFRRVITKFPISDYFNDYTGGVDCFYACKFFADKFFKVHPATSRVVLPVSAVDSESVSDVALCIRDLFDLDGYHGVTAWSWAAMDPDFSRERRSYMRIPNPSEIKE